MELSPPQVGGTPNVAALVREGVRREAALESPDVVVLALPDAATLGELRRAMTRSAALVESLAGE